MDLIKSLLEQYPDPPSERPSDPRTVDIRDAYWHPHVFRVLSEMGAKTMGDVSALTPGKLLTAKRMGPASVQRIQELLSEYGLSLSEDDPADVPAKRERNSGPSNLSRAACSVYDPSLLAVIRRAAKLTQAQISDALGVKPDLVRQWEKGERTPGAPNILRYLIACNASPKDVCRKESK